jgi:phenylalanyl-tRNA synthetase beta chain
MLGLNLDAESITGHLTGLHMCVTPNGPDNLTVISPTHRYDIGSQIDLIEEIARMNGYDSIPVTYPLVNLVPVLPNLDRNVASQTRTLLASSGFSEVVNFSFQDPELLNTLRFKDDDERNDPVQLLNPLSASQSVMRTTVLGSLLQNLQHNLNANRSPALAIFEISNVFFKTTNGKIREDRKLGGLVYGEKNTNTWAHPNRSVDIFDIKGCVETLFSILNIAVYRFETDSNEPYLAPKTGIQVFIEDTYCGSCGTLHPDISEAFDAHGPVHVFELDFNQICAYYSSQKTYTSFSRFPAVHRDLALVIDQSVTSADVNAAIEAYKNKLLRQWNIFDFYQGGSIAKGKKSIAFRLTFQSDERTLTDKEVNKIHDKLLDSLRKQLGVELR